MRIGFLCKRQYMGKDVILDRYARLYELPFQLSRRGHQVLGMCLSYQGHEVGSWIHADAPGSLTWESRALGRMPAAGVASYPITALRRLKAFQPDLLIGASDIPHVALASWLATRLQLPYLVDLYDNFEGYGQARIPGMKWLLRRATRNADLVTTTSEPLAALVREVYQARGKVIALPSTIDHAVFKPLDRSFARSQLGLPPEARLVGTAGGLQRDKGVDTLYQAWQKLAAQDPNLHLVLAGPFDPDFPPPSGERVRYLGQLPHARTALLFAALDVGVIYMRDTLFGRYCFPQKAYEMLACGLPLAVTRVGAMKDLFADVPRCLYEPDDAESLAACIRSQLTEPSHPSAVIEDWATLIGRIEPEICKLVQD